MLESECDWKMHVRNLEYTLPLQSGAQTHFSLTTLQLNGNFNGPDNFGNKHDLHNRASVLITTKSLLHDLKMPWTFVHNRHFYPPSANSALYFIATLGLKLRRWRSTTGTQPNSAKRWTVNSAYNLTLNSRGHPSQKLDRGQRRYTFGRFFDVFET